MNSRTAPRAATWLLERLGGASPGGSSRLEPLIGDLLEQFEGGRSQLWYWRQAAGALAIDGAQTLRIHAPTFIAAIVVGCASIWLCNAGWPLVFHLLHANLSALSLHPWTAQAVLRVVGMELCTLLADALILVTVRVVTRIHRSHPRTMLSIFAAAVSVQYIPGIARLVIHAATDPRFTAPVVSLHLHLMMPVAWQALCILAAGLWVVRRPRFTGTDRLTCFVAILAASLCIVSGLAHAAGLVGELTYTLHEQYLSDVLNVASVAYLVLLLWCPSSARRVAGQPPTHAGGGPRTEAEKSA